MRALPFACFVLAFSLTGCFEGTKPEPLARAGRTVEIATNPVTKPEIIIEPPPVVEDEKVPIPEPLTVKPEPRPSLYERLGKEPAIAKVIDDLVEIVAADENIREKHRKHFMEGDVSLLKRKMVDQLGEATGGPQKYTGKNMKDAHKGMEITNKDFDALAADVIKSRCSAACARTWSRRKISNYRKTVGSAVRTNRRAG
ncbi:MAG: hemoglobin [bacterium]|nr:MAG: hemoglobin [bacterium]